MNFIIDSLSYVLGWLLDFFFRGLTFIGYPRLWLCIVLYTIVTKALFLPQRINSCKSTLLAPVVKRDLLAVDPGFFGKTKDKELTLKRSALKKEINKKYKLRNSSGCLSMLIQYPFLVALFYVVKNPQEFIPSFESLSNASPNVNTLFGLSLASIPNNVSLNGTEALILLVPLIIAISNVVKMLPSIRQSNTPSAKIIACSVCILITALLTWVSTTLPVAISLYWLVGDLAFSVFDFFINKHLAKDKNISAILKQYNEEKENSLSEKEKSETINATAIDAVSGVNDALNSETTQADVECSLNSVPTQADIERSLNSAQCGR